MKKTPEKLKILIADDEKWMVDLCIELFKNDYEVITASCGTSALELFKEHKPNIVISDQRMPGIQGTELFEEICKIEPTTYRILLTGYTEQDIIIKAINNGAIHKYITKPVSTFDLKNIVNESAKQYLASMELEFLHRETEKQKNELDIANKQLKEANEKLQLLTAELEKEVIKRVSQLQETTNKLLEVNNRLNSLFKISHKIAGALQEEIIISYFAETLFSSYLFKKIIYYKRIKEEQFKKTEVYYGKNWKIWTEDLAEVDINQSPYLIHKLLSHSMPIVHENFLYIPLIAKEMIFGILAAEISSETPPLDTIETQLLHSISAYIGVMCENAKLFRKIMWLSVKDGLTRLFNHRYFQESLSKEISRSRRYNLPLSIAVGDIDHFKKINDTYGHKYGDKILIEIAKILKSSSRKSDVVSRYGGEEFAIIMPQTPLSGAITIAERIRLKVKEKMYDVGGNLINVTMSFGVATLTEEIGTDAGKLFEQADSMLYIAKNSGRDRVVAVDNNYENSEISYKKNNNSIENVIIG